MKWMHLQLKVLAVFLFFVSCFAAAEEYHAAHASNWVKQHKLLTPEIPRHQIRDGTFYLMLDTQL